MSVDPQIGLLLPCNVVVRDDPTEKGAVLVEAMNPQLLFELTNEPALKELAEQVATKLQAAINIVANAEATATTR